MNGSWLLALTRTIQYLALTLILMPVQALALAAGSPFARRLPRIYHRWTTRIFGFDVVVRGVPSEARPTLFVSNHSSYFDIEILASILETSFIAKAEMKSWPLIGWLAKLQTSVFVDRRPRNVGDHRNEITRRLAAGDQLVLFAEGTTSDGNRMLPFKTALFSVAEQGSGDLPLIIQPVSIVATALDGIPLGRSFRSLYAWYGDMSLAPHAWTALSLGHITVVVEFHPSFDAKGLSRKELAERCRVAVSAGVARAITGRYTDSPKLEAGKVKVPEGAAIDAAA